MPLHSSSGRWRLGLALSLVTVFLWGILPIALTVTLQALDVYTVIWFRFLVSFILLALYLAAQQQSPSSSETSSEYEKVKVKNRIPKESQSVFLPFGFYLTHSEISLLAIATIFLALNYIFFLQGLSRTTPANAQVLIQLAPVLMSLGGLAIFKERYTIRQYGGLGILTIGFALFFHEQLRNLITAQGKYLVGCGFILLAAVVWAIYALAQKQLLHRLASSHIMLLIYGGCALLFSPVAAPQLLVKLSPLQLGMLCFCAVNTVTAYGAFAESLEHWEASKVGAVLALTPVVTLVSVWVVSYLVPTLIASEHLTILGISGAALVVAGSIAIALGKNS